MATNKLTDPSKFTHMELFTVARTLEALLDINPKIGNESRPSQSPLRFGQSALLSFPSKQIREIDILQGKINIDISGFGVFGPNGALPLHISEEIYEKRLQQKDRTFNDFLNIFHHRLTSLFYKSWREAQEIPSLDNEDSWQFSRYIASLSGISDHKDYTSCVSVYSKMYYTRYLQNKSRPVHNLQSIISNYFQVEAKIKENLGQWVDATDFSTTLSYKQKNILGDGLMIGKRFFDATKKFRIIIGPIEPNKYLQFLKEGKLAEQLIMWVEQFAHYEYQWDVEIIVDRLQIKQQTLGSGLALGQTSWVGVPRQNPRVLIQYSS